MHWGSSPAAIAARLTAVAQAFVADGPAERAERAKRGILSAVSAHEPATLGDVAQAVGRGAPAISRAVDTLVRAGLIERTPDPNNRRRLAMRLSDSGRDTLARPPAVGGSLGAQLTKLAPSELRAIERAVEIHERAPR
jgi:DNA-binding MarR family transcriptional regulator